MKCDIPSFMADIVKILSWTDDTGNEYFPDEGNKLGNFIIKSRESINICNQHHTSIYQDTENAKPFVMKRHRRCIVLVYRFLIQGDEIFIIDAISVFAQFNANLYEV